MTFNPDLTKEVQKSSLVIKQKNYLVLPWCLIMQLLINEYTKKHLGIKLDSRLTLDIHLKMATIKINKTVRFLHKLQNLLPKTVLITIRKLL